MFLIDISRPHKQRSFGFVKSGGFEQGEWARFVRSDRDIHISVAAADWISAAVRATGIEQRLRTGETLFRSGEETLGLYEVIGGKVRIVRAERSGRETVVQVAAIGGTVGEASIFSPAYDCDAIATRKAVVRLYPKAVVLSEFERDPALLQAFAAVLAQQVVALRTRLELRNIRSASDRVRRFLAINVGADGRSVALSGTLRELAADLGLTHEALYRALARMEAAGEITRTARTIRMGRII